MDKTTRHHIYGKSRNGTNSPNNIKRLPEKLHHNIHRLFHNKTPIEQMRMMMDINLTALSAEFHDEVTRLLDYWDLQEMRDDVVNN